MTEKEKHPSINEEMPSSIIEKTIDDNNIIQIKEWLKDDKTNWSVLLHIIKSHQYDIFKKISIYDLNKDILKDFVQWFEGAFYSETLLDWVNNYPELLELKDHNDNSLAMLLIKKSLEKRDDIFKHELYAMLALIVETKPELLQEKYDAKHTIQEIIDQKLERVITVKPEIIFGAVWKNPNVLLYKSKNGDSLFKQIVSNQGYKHEDVQGLINLVAKKHPEFFFKNYDNTQTIVEHLINNAPNMLFQRYEPSERVADALMMTKPSVLGTLTNNQDSVLKLTIKHRFGEYEKGLYREKEEEFEVFLQQYLQWIIDIDEIDLLKQKYDSRQTIGQFLLINIPLPALLTVNHSGDHGVLSTLTLVYEDQVKLFKWLCINRRNLLNHKYDETNSVIEFLLQNLDHGAKVEVFKWLCGNSMNYILEDRYDEPRSVISFLLEKADDETKLDLFKWVVKENPDALSWGEDVFFEYFLGPLDIKAKIELLKWMANNVSGDLLHTFDRKDIIGKFFTNDLMAKTGSFSDFIKKNFKDDDYRPILIRWMAKHHPEILEQEYDDTQTIGEFFSKVTKKEKMRPRTFLGATEERTSEEVRLKNITIITTVPGGTLGDVIVCLKLIEGLIKQNPKLKINLCVSVNKKNKAKVEAVVPNISNLSCHIMPPYNEAFSMDFNTLQKLKSIYQNSSGIIMSPSMRFFHKDLDEISNNKIPIIALSQYNRFMSDEIRYKPFPILTLGFDDQHLGIFIEDFSVYQSEHKPLFETIDKKDQKLKEFLINARDAQEYQRATELYYGYHNTVTDAIAYNNFITPTSFIEMCIYDTIEQNTNKNVDIVLNFGHEQDVKHIISSLQESTLFSLEDVTIEFYKKSDDKFVSMRTIGTGEKVVRVIDSFPMAHDTTKQLLVKSNTLCMSTGDHSFSETLSAGDKITFYQLMNWQHECYSGFLTEVKMVVGESSELYQFFSNISKKESTSIDGLRTTRDRMVFYHKNKEPLLKQMGKLSLHLKNKNLYQILPEEISKLFYDEKHYINVSLASMMKLSDYDTSFESRSSFYGWYDLYNKLTSVDDKKYYLEKIMTNEVFVRDFIKCTYMVVLYNKLNSPPIYPRAFDRTRIITDEIFHKRNYSSFLRFLHIMQKENLLDMGKLLGNVSGKQSSQANDLLLILTSTWEDDPIKYLLTEEIRKKPPISMLHFAVRDQDLELAKIILTKAKELDIDLHEFITKPLQSESVQSTPSEGVFEEFSAKQTPLSIAAENNDHKMLSYLTKTAKEYNSSLEKTSGMEKRV